jgi:hypothetical protein
MKEGKMEGAKTNTKDIAQEIYDTIDHDIYKTKKEIKAYLINKFPTYTSGEIDLIATNFMLIKKENGI